MTCRRFVGDSRALAALLLVATALVSLEGQAGTGGRSESSPSPPLSRTTAASRRSGDGRTRKAGVQHRLPLLPRTDLRGGDMGGPNLLRSDVMLNDEKGELLGQSCGRAGRMPACPRSNCREDDARLCRRTFTACSHRAGRRARRHSGRRLR